MDNNKSANRIRRKHLDFVVDVEIAESILEPAELPRRIFKDRMNPLESMRPLEFRITFGMFKGGILIHRLQKFLESLSSVVIDKGHLNNFWDFGPPPLLVCFWD